MEENNKILIVDDQEPIHEILKAILLTQVDEDSDITSFEKELFGKDTHLSQLGKVNCYKIDDAYNGEEAISMIKDACEKGAPYAVAFIDEKMPPGTDGIEIIPEIWKIDPYIEIVICTAYLNYSWHEVITKLGYTDRFLILKKPFDTLEGKQIASALIKKWNLNQKARFYKEELEKKIKEQEEIINSMFSFSNELHSSETLDDILSCIIRNVVKFIKAERVSIMLADEDGKSLTLQKGYGLPEEIIKKSNIPINYGIANEVFKSGKALFINNMSQKGYSKNYSEYDGFISTPFICSPLTGHKVKLGVVNVTNKKDNLPFTKEDYDLLNHISYSSAIAINNQLNEIKLEETFLGVIKALASAIDAKDPYTKGHSERVAYLAVEIAKEMGLSQEEIKFLNFAAILHDIGKIGVPECILSKPDKLTDSEFKLVKEHPIIGENILKEVKFLDKARAIIRQHHERIDGKGYPDGITGENISLEAKIIAVADTYDAMNSDRPYRKTVSFEKIIQELEEVSGRQLDKECVFYFFKYLRRIKKL